MANYHQHLFSLRIDPSIDGQENTVVQEDSVAMPFEVKNAPRHIPFGVGYVVEKTTIDDDEDFWLGRCCTGESHRRRSRLQGGSCMHLRLAIA